jgi:hypothetical protein
MQCCICGEDFQDGDMIIRVTAHRFESEGPVYNLLRSRFEDGSDEKLSHMSCPIVAGGPMALIGATGERNE